MRAALFSFVCKQSKPLGHPQEWTQDKSQIFSFELIRLSWFIPGGRESTRLRGATVLERDIRGVHLSTTPSRSWVRRLLIARSRSLSLGTRSDELHRLSYYLELRTLSSSLFVIPLVQMEPTFHKEWVTFVEMLLHDLSGPTKSG